MRKSKKLLSMTGRFVFIVGILLSAYGFAMFQGGKVSWTIFYILFPFILYSIALFVYPMNTITAERKILTKNIENGGKLTVTVTLKRRFSFPLLYTIVTEKWGSHQIELRAKNKSSYLFVFGMRKQVEWTYEIDRLPRGQHITEGIHIELSDFFGWIRKTAFIPLRESIIVFPKTVPMNYMSLDAQYDRGAIASPFTLIKDTTMATGVREYQAGDRVTWIHWKSFARTQNLMTKEFEDRQSEDLLVVLDERASEQFEEQIELAASLVKEAIQQQANVSFISVGEHKVEYPFIHSAEQLHDLLVHLAKIEPVESPPHSMDWTPSMRIGGSIVFITGSPDWEILQSLGGATRANSSIICFVVVGEGKRVPKSLSERISYARMKGVKIITLRKTQFANAFREEAM